jgi:phage terminase large subunit-like protein
MRRFTEFLFLVARKNAKSTLVAGILLYCLCEEDEPGAQVVAAATTGDQARIVFAIAQKMVERLPTLREHYDVEAFTKAIVRYGLAGGTFKPINAKASTQDGLNPSAVSLDEIHAHKTHDLLNVLRSAAGARDNPLWLYPTTEGYENSGPWSELRTMAEQILERVLEADHFLAIIFAADEEDDDFSERAVRKANPLYDFSPRLREKIAQLQVAARAMPGTLGEYRIKRLNRRSSNAQARIDLRKWRRCSGPVPLEKLRGQPCWAGLDLASTADMTAWALLWYVDEVYYCHMRYWVPEAAVAQRTERRSVNYAGWVAGGFITQTEGDVADYDVIERDLLEDFETFAPRVIGYDPWNAHALVNRLSEAGLPLQLFRQGPASYHPAIQELERAYLSRRLRHGGHPVLLWNAANVVARTDANLNVAPDRKRSREKIDGFCALAEAFGVSLIQNEEGDFDEFLKRPAQA